MKPIKYIACLAGFFILTRCIAQEEGDGKVWLGLNISTYHFTVQNTEHYPMPYYSKNMRQVPFKAGLDLKIKLNKRLGLSTGLLLDVMTAKNTETQQVTDWKGNPIYEMKSVNKVRQIYLEVPVRADMRFSSRKVAPLLTIGAAPRVFLKQKYTYTSDYKGVKSSYSFEDHLRLDGPSEQLDCSFQLGFGVDATLKKIKLQAFPMYEFSFLAGTQARYGHKIGLALSACYQL